MGEAGRILSDELQQIATWKTKEAEPEMHDEGRLPVVMVHENDPELNGCEFSHLFKSTPKELIDDDLYYATAHGLFSGPFYPVSAAIVAQALGATPDASRAARGC